MTSSPRLTDAQRAAAIDRADESIALLSGAGCGKTFVLSKRYVQLLLAGGEEADISRIVALTFTDKAAVEMSQRVRRELLTLAENAEGSRRRMLLGWLEQLPQARISTIHSFCASILRQAAVEAGVDPAFAVCADNLLVEQLVTEAADEALLSAVEAGDSQAAALLGDHPFQQTVELIANLIDKRTAVDLDAYGDAAAIMARWHRQLKLDRADAWLRLESNEDASRLIDQLQAIGCDDNSDKLLPLRNELLAAAQAMMTSAEARTPQGFSAINIKPGNVGADRNWGGDKGAAKAVRHLMKALSATLGQYAIFAEELGPADQRSAESIAALVGLTARASELYTRAKRTRGLLDFTDLMERTGRLLDDNASVRKTLAGGIDQILIDECQDTDAQQVSLLSRLIYAATDAAPGAPLPPGRVFVVGDAKQSIYRFRGAQVEVFDSLCRQMGKANVENLDISFRTHAAGVEFVNELFAPLMGDHYDAIKAHRTDSRPAPGVEVLLALGPDGQAVKTADAACEAQAIATAERIATMLESGEELIWDSGTGSHRPVRARDICILMARMTDSLRYERQLQQRNIPYYVVAGTGFFRRQEIHGILNALRAIDCPQDDLAFFGALRSDMFGLDDNSLMHLAGMLEQPYLPSLTKDKLQAAAALLTGAQQESLTLAVRTFEDLRRCKDAISTDSLIERLLDACGYEAALLSQPQGKRMLGNVRMLVDRARAASADGMALADFITQIQQQVISQTRYEQAAVVSEADNVVRIMTIHKAKGLEFPVVILPDLNTARHGPASSTLIRHDWGLTWRTGTTGDDDLTDADEDTPPLSSEIARQLEDADMRAEDIRKWYVAATRHSDHLIFVAADWRDRTGAFRNGGCFLSKMDQVLGIANAVDAEKTTIPYAGGTFEIALRRVTPSAAFARGKVSAGAKLLAGCADGGDFARRLAAMRTKAPAPPLLGPVPLTSAQAQLAVTALGQFQHCPMQYRWQYELRVPAAMLPSTQKRGAAPAPLIDAATAGTIFHRCMELLNFAHPQKPEVLIGRVAEEMALTEQPGLSDLTGLSALAGDLRDMLGVFESSELRRELIDAGSKPDREFRELDFALPLDQVLLRGQIDMLYFDDAGAAHIVDYKSDRLADGEDPATHAQRYHLQMLVYALATRAHFGKAPADAMLYFLRSGQCCRIELTAERMESAEREIGELCRRLIAARRSGNFEKCEGEHCDHCAYRALCQRGCGRNTMAS